MAYQPQQQQRRDDRRDRRPVDSDEKQYDERVVHIDRVAKVVKGGRRFHFRVLTAVGDHAGNIGIGVAKGTDVTSAVTKSVSVAKKNMTKINLYNETIPHEAEAKVSGAHILIKPAAPGTGLKAGGVVRIVLEVAGVRNVLSKSLGSSNKINAAYATFKALTEIEPQEKWVTRTVYTKSDSSKTETPKTSVNDEVTKADESENVEKPEVLKLVKSPKPKAKSPTKKESK
jgi:small subunit ribosomal protein S5